MQAHTAVDFSSFLAENYNVVLGIPCSLWETGDLISILTLRRWFISRCRLLLQH